MSKVAPGCNICVLGSEPCTMSASSTEEGFGCKLASAAKCVILKNREVEECLASRDLHSAGSLGLSTQDL